MMSQVFPYTARRSVFAGSFGLIVHACVTYQPDFCRRQPTLDGVGCA